jgi:hypothetical protein
MGHVFFFQMKTILKIVHMERWINNHNLIATSCKNDQK